MGLTYKQKFNRRHGQPLDQSNSLAQVARLSGHSLKSLRIIYRKGQGAFHSNPQSVRPGKTREQWAMARVYASITPGSKSHKIDKVHL